MSAEAGTAQRTPEMPQELLVMLEELRPLLERQGSLVRRTNALGATVWRLRFKESGPDGRKHQRSYVLCYGEATVRVVETWLRNCQRAYRLKVEAERKPEEEQVAKERRHKKNMAALRSYCVRAGQSRRHRQELGKAFDAVSGDTGKALMMCERIRFFGPSCPNPAGRPTTRRIW